METQLLSNGISKNVLKDDLKFLIDSIEFNGGLDFRLLPFQKLNKNDFDKKYMNKLAKKTKEHIDFIGAYHITSYQYEYIEHKHNNQTSHYKIKEKLANIIQDDAHVIYKLDNGYWVYSHLYSARSGLTPWGIDEVINYTSKDLDELITYGITKKDRELLGI